MVGQVRGSCVGSDSTLREKTLEPIKASSTSAASLKHVVNLRSIFCDEMSLMYHAHSEVFTTMRVKSRRRVSTVGSWPPDRWYVTGNGAV